MRIETEAFASNYDEIGMEPGMIALQLISVGTSTGTIITKEMLTRLQVEKGDTLYAIETAEGYLLTPYDPTIDEQLKTGQEFMKKYRETFKALAR